MRTLLETANQILGRSRYFLAVFAASILVSNPSFAQNDTSSDCKQSPVNTDSLIMQLDSPDIDSQKSASAEITQKWSVYLPALLDSIQGPSTSGAPINLGTKLVTISTILSGSQNAIRTFRACRTPQSDRILTEFTNSDDPVIRKNSTLILANTVDNTNICIILSKLKDTSLTDNGRINILGIINSMAGYAYLENVRSINSGLDELKIRLQNKPGDASKSLFMIESIKTRANQSYNARQEQPDFLKFSCPTN